MTKLILSLVSCGCLLILAAAPPSIGTVKSNGEFRVDGAAIRGNSTLFEGNIVETGEVRSVVQVGSVQMTLLPESRARIYRDRTVLEKGSGLVSGAPSQRFEAATLRIAPAAANSVLQVEVAGPGRVAVAAHTGIGEVRNASGVLVASVRPGMALAFDAGAAAPGVKIRPPGAAASALRSPAPARRCR